MDQLSGGGLCPSWAPLYLLPAWGYSGSFWLAFWQDTGQEFTLQGQPQKAGDCLHHSPLPWIDQPHFPCPSEGS